VIALSKSFSESECNRTVRSVSVRTGEKEGSSLNTLSAVAQAPVFCNRKNISILPIVNTKSEVS